MMITSPLQIFILLELFLSVHCSSLLCPQIEVYNAEYADCNGEYRESKIRVDWAPERVVYKHTSKDRYIFWNAAGLGWSIGKKEYLEDGRHWHKSGSDASEPWQEKWRNNVGVRCKENQDSCCQNIEVISTGDALLDQPLYIGVYKRQPEPTQSRLSARLSTPQSTLSARSLLLPMPSLPLLPTLLLQPMLTPPMLLLQPMLMVPTLMVLTLLPLLLLLLKHNNSVVAAFIKYLTIVIGLCLSSAVSSSWWPWWLLSSFRCWITSNVLVMPLQYDIYSCCYFKTSGTFVIFVMLNALFVRYRRELFIK